MSVTYSMTVQVPAVVNRNLFPVWTYPVQPETAYEYWFPPVPPEVAFVKSTDWSALMWSCLR